jgi:hypothetical protein
MLTFRVNTPNQLGQYVRSFNKLVKFSFWFGAGASVGAGVPSAKDLTTQVLDRFGYLMDKSAVADGVSPFSDAFCKLVPLGRKLFIHEAMGMTRGINPAHRIAARLNAEGWINLLLTSNFDDLLLRAARETGDENPWVVDLRNDMDTEAEAMRPGSLVYLNGVANSYRICGKSQAPEALIRSQRKAFLRAATNSVVIVLGVSGDHDPLFEFFTENLDYPHGLFWVTHSETPPDHITKKILSIKNAGFFGGHDADEFMKDLASGLGLGAEAPAAAARAPAEMPFEPTTKVILMPEPEVPETHPPEKKNKKQAAEVEEEAPVKKFDEEEAIKYAHEALVIGGSETLLALGHDALKFDADRACGPISEALLDWGRQMFDEGRIALAHEAFSLVTELVPESADGYIEMQKVAEKKGDASLAARLALKIYALGHK